MMFKLDNVSLESHVLETIEPIRDLVNLKEIHFAQNYHGCDEGTYVFSDGQGYHFVYSERGNETKHKLTDDLFEITFWTVNSIITSIVVEMLQKNIAEIENQREYIFKQCLLLMEKIGPNFKKAIEIQIDELIKENPL